eukprot:COSAG01_NODE_286_length_19421_cov_123.895663_8_plen_178_part_00
MNHTRSRAVPTPGGLRTAAGCDRRRPAAPAAVRFFFRDRTTCELENGCRLEDSSLVLRKAGNGSFITLLCMCVLRHNTYYVPNAMKSPWIAGCYWLIPASPTRELCLSSQLLATIASAMEPCQLCPSSQMRRTLSTMPIKLDAADRWAATCLRLPASWSIVLCLWRGKSATNHFVAH